MGAWIEISMLFSVSVSCPVAPLVGAWIEINVTENKVGIDTVAPLVGAWIEITWFWIDIFQFRRRSPRGSVD